MPATPPPPKTALASFRNWIGVDLGPTVIRAGVYDAQFRFLGKIRLSSKRERGPNELIGRVARCIRYAVDECDLDIKTVQAVGIGVSGRVQTETGRVLAASGLHWHDVSLRAELAAILGLPVFAANLHDLAALGIYRTELIERPRRFAALFPGPRIGGALMENGAWVDPAPLRLGDKSPDAGQENIFAVMPGEPFQGFRGKDFKKALRKGNKPVEQFVRIMAARTGEVAAELMERFQPETIAIGGGVMEEMQDELMEIIEGAAGKRITGATGLTGPRPQFFASTLGDYAPLAGGAVWAAQQTAGVAAA